MDCHTANSTDSGYNCINFGNLHCPNTSCLVHLRNLQNNPDTRPYCFQLEDTISAATSLPLLALVGHSTVVYAASLTWRQMDPDHHLLIRPWTVSDFSEDSAIYTNSYFS